MPLVAGAANVEGDWTSGHQNWLNATSKNNLFAIRSDGNFVALTGATNTVTAAQNRCMFTVGTADMVITLPATLAGLRYTFCVKTVSAGTGCQISPAAADAIHFVTSVDDKDLINTAATDVEGDSVTLVADGVDGWWVLSGVNGIWAKEA